MSIQQLVYTLRTWLVPFRYGLERWSYTLQRVSGVAITLFFVAHIVETGNVVGGASVWSIPPYELAKKVWTETEAFLANPLFDLGLSVLGFLIFFHAFNGVRLVPRPLRHHFEETVSGQNIPTGRARCRRRRGPYSG
jgi:succinate dehydrogenase/fumarate reductase cytochrome b subunit